jgi:hypothetical protein
MEEIIYQKSYQEFRDELKVELNKTAESFVRIGYLLKVARDTDILATSGYSDLEDFARGEFDLDKSQVSRFIRINDRFSEGGNSDRLIREYADFGVRKLGIMLTLPTEITEDLKPGYTVGEIESIKETYDAEQKVTPLEDYAEQMEAKAENNKAAEIAEDDILTAVLYQIGHDDAALFRQMYESEDLTGSTDLFSVLAPGGESTHKVRIKGVGALIVVCEEEKMTITNMRTLGKDIFSWADANKAFDGIVNTEKGAEDSKLLWQQVYGELYPENTEVAPVQQKKVVDHTKEAEHGDRERNTAPSGVSQEKAEPEEKTGEEVSSESEEPVKESVEEKPLAAVVEKVEDVTVVNTDHEEEPMAAGMDDWNEEAVRANVERSRANALNDIYQIKEIVAKPAEENQAEDIGRALSKLSRLKMNLEMLMACLEEWEKHSPSDEI